MKLSLFFLIIYLLNYGCISDSPVLGKNEREIISFMIDKVAYPMPNPPDIDHNDTIISQDLVDSLLKSKIKVAIFPSMPSLINIPEMMEIPEEYLELIDLEKSDVFINEIEGISSLKGHEISLADTVELQKSKEFKNHDLVVNFSRIYIDEDGARAIFELGVSRSRLAGTSTIYCLKKEKNEWKIDFAKFNEEW